MTSRPRYLASSTVRQNLRDQAVAEQAAQLTQTPDELLSTIEGYLQLAKDAELVAAVKLNMDGSALFRRQLANRGLDLDGKWVGFDAARKACKV